ncbi:hypothetical protein ACFRAQ_34475 [Nocardia sp. NPDC056611]|uniref:hypothetical protein n=1 Tax=Nocardia sp. NPDC056611 TaxID=3345877 RepID=UPI00366E136B
MLALFLFLGGGFVVFASLGWWLGVAERRAELALWGVESDVETEPVLGCTTVADITERIAREDRVKLAA